MTGKVFYGPAYTAALRSIDAKIAMLTKMRDIVHSFEFGRAIHVIRAAGGKIVVTGIGKSGYVGRKIAATFQSVGIHAVFLHPAEAAHGDMGLLQRSDVLLMLSNSGETSELEIVVNRANHLEVASIIITSRPEGFLSKAATMMIPTPRIDEGCPIERAPMASTAAQLAIGDAIAAAIMVERNFTAEDFAQYHHGGYLGRVARAVA